MTFASSIGRLLGHCLNAFGEEQTVEFRPASGSPYEIRGIFDKQYTLVDQETGVEVVTAKPNLGVRLADFAAKPVQGDKVTVRTVSYMIETVLEDGQGGALLVLRQKA